MNIGLTNRNPSCQFQSRIWILKSLFLVLLSLGLGSNCLNAAQQEMSPISVATDFDKSNVLVAEQIHMDITVTAPEGVKVKLPIIGQHMGDLDVIKVQDSTDIPGASGRTTKRRIVLESLMPGEFEIPAIDIGFVDRRDNSKSPITGVQKTDRQIITVGSTLEGAEDPREFRDIKSVIFMPESDELGLGWLVWTFAGAGVLAVVAIAIAVARRRSPTVPPKQWALHAIDELEASRVFCEGDSEQVYVRVTAIVRSFIEREANISAPRLTTSEFLDRIRNHRHLSGTLRQDLDDFLSSADMVKFAGVVPGRDELDKVVLQARQLVEQSFAQVEQTGIRTLPQEVA